MSVSNDNASLPGIMFILKFSSKKAIKLIFTFCVVNNNPITLMSCFVLTQVYICKADGDESVLGKNERTKLPLLAFATF